MNLCFNSEEHSSLKTAQFKYQKMTAFPVVAYIFLLFLPYLCKSVVWPSELLSHTGKLLAVFCAWADIQDLVCQKDESLWEAIYLPSTMLQISNWKKPIKKVGIDSDWLRDFSPLPILVEFPLRWGWGGGCNSCFPFSLLYPSLYWLQWKTLLKLKVTGNLVFIEISYLLDHSLDLCIIYLCIIYFNQ